MDGMLDYSLSLKIQSAQAKVESAKIFPQGCNIRESKVMENGSFRMKTS